MLSNIFKAYDVRGTIPNDLNEEVVEQIGKAFVTLVKDKEIIVGQDMRDSSKPLVAAFTKGVNSMGADVLDIDQVCTDATYFAAGFLNKPAVMFTASHNPANYNGLKFSKQGAVPVNQDTGLLEMKSMIEKGTYKPVSSNSGTRKDHDILPEYVKHVHSFAAVKSLKPLKVAVDAGNGMAGKIIPLVYRDLPTRIIPLFFELDGSFPNHPADPSKSENLKWLQEKVSQEDCDLGMAFDGDADRIFFVDEQGEVVNSSLITALITKNMLEKNPRSTIIHNVVCSHIVPDTIQKYGGKAVKERVGHSFIKETMRKTNAVFAGEHSAHYYYRDNYRADSGMITSILILEALSHSDKPLSQLLAEFKVYHTLEETSVRVANKEQVIKKIKETFEQQSPQEFSDLDGVTFEFKEWWFNVRPSNTEPLLRLNMEATSAELLKEKKEELLGLLGKE